MSSSAGAAGLPGRSAMLMADDGHELSAYRADPDEAPIAGLVVLQEIFGLNSHIREVRNGFAARGYATVSPALFDRVRRGTELSYGADGVETGRNLRAKIGWDDAVRDVRAAVDLLLAEKLPVAVIGYCWGGTLAFLTATRVAGVSCVVSYYGGQTIPFVSEAPRVPVLMHFGEHEPRVPERDREEIRRHNPQIEMHVFPADHGFNCDHRKEYHRESADRALRLTLAFLGKHLSRNT